MADRWAASSLRAYGTAPGPSGEQAARVRRGSGPADLAGLRRGSIIPHSAGGRTRPEPPRGHVVLRVLAARGPFEFPASLHDYLAGQRQLALSPAAVSELLARLEAQWEDVLVLYSGSLIFRLTPRQKRTQRIIAAVSAPTGAALAGLGIAADKYVIGYVLMLVAVGALLAACMSLNNARAFTKCTPSGLRARTVLGRLREWPWPQVANISVKQVSGRGSTYSAVMVTTTAGRRMRLAAPTSGILTPEEFTTSAKQIQDYWRAATAATGQPSEP